MDASIVRKRYVSLNEKKLSSAYSKVNAMVSKETGSDVIYEESIRPWFLPVLVLAAPIIPWFYNYSVILTKDFIEFGYTLNMRKRINYNDILAFQILEDVNGLSEYGGYGVKMNFSGTTGYIVENGPCIKLHLKAKPNSSYVFSVKNASRIGRELRSHGASEIY